MNKTIIAFTVLLILGLSAVASAKSIKAHSKAIYNKQYSRDVIYGLAGLATAATVVASDPKKADVSDSEVEDGASDPEAEDDASDPEEAAAKKAAFKRIRVKVLVLLLPLAGGYFIGRFCKGELRSILLSVEATALFVVTGLSSNKNLLVGSQITGMLANHGAWVLFGQAVMFTMDILLNNFLTPKFAVSADESSEEIIDDETTDDESSTGSNKAKIAIIVIAIALVAALVAGLIMKKRDH